MNSERCTSCGHSAPALFRVGDLNRRLSAKTFPYFRCPKCRLVFQSPLPDDLGMYYPQEYYGKTQTIADLEPTLGPERYKLTLVQRFLRSGRLLEVGPSRGEFAYLAKESGFDVSAIERDTECCRFLSEVVGIQAINDTDPAAALARQEPYDMIALWQVIEHLDDPWKFLQVAADKLNPGGYLFIAAPNPDSLQFRLFGRFWAHLDAPRHLQLIPASLLATRGASLGLSEALLNTTGDQELDRFNEFSWQRSITNLLGRKTITPFIKQNMTRVAWKLRRYEQEQFRGCCYTLALQKRV